MGSVNGSSFARSSKEDDDTELTEAPLDTEDTNKPQVWWCTYCSQLALSALCEHGGCEPAEHDQSCCRTCEQLGLACDVGIPPPPAARAEQLQLQGSFDDFSSSDNVAPRQSDFYNAQTAVVRRSASAGVDAAWSEIIARNKYIDVGHEMCRNFQRPPWGVLKLIELARHSTALRSLTSWDDLPTNRNAIVGLEVQLRGTVIRHGCKNCQNGLGHFAECVVLIVQGAYFQGQAVCGNCLATKKSKYSCNLDDVPEVQQLVSAATNKPATNKAATNKAATNKAATSNDVPSSRKRLLATHLDSDSPEKPMEPQPSKARRYTTLSTPSSTTVASPRPSPEVLLANFSQVLQL
ncbi:hypothetical protein PG984_011215 [Apiospora sp. TS-2023a]